MDGFVTKDSGARREFSTGSVRDVALGKGRYDLIPRDPLHRVAQLYERGAVKYAANNWRLGQPMSQLYSSMLRHAFEAQAGWTDEDHLAAVVWNAFAIMDQQQRIERGELPAELDDMFRTGVQSTTEEVTWWQRLKSAFASVTTAGKRTTSTAR